MQAQNDYSAPSVRTTELIRTSQSWDGMELPDYLQGRPELVAMKYEIPAGQKLAWHSHPVMNHGILVQGELTIISEDGKEKVVREGEAIVEMVNTIHHGENRGSKPVILYMFYLSQKGLPLSVQHPTFLPFSCPIKEKNNTLEVEETKTTEEDTNTKGNIEGNALPQTIQDNIGSLLQQHCIDTKLYLQQDLTLFQLARAIGTNHSYLSQYFSSHGMTYNTYINILRINHFVILYREAATTQRPFTAQQLAIDSGFRSYSTFSLAFKKRMGQNVTTWIHNSAK